MYKKDITIVDGKYVGVKQKNGDPVPIDELLGTEPIDIPIHYGILLPQQEILSRYKYAWFARMSPEQILNGTLMINKYIIMSIKSNQIYCQRTLFNTIWWRIHRYAYTGNMGYLLPLSVDEIERLAGILIAFSILSLSSLVRSVAICPGLSNLEVTEYPSQL